MHPAEPAPTTTMRFAIVSLLLTSDWSPVEVGGPGRGSAIDDELGAGAIRGLVRAEVHGQRRDLGRSSQPADRPATDDFISRFRPHENVVASWCGHRRIHPAGEDAVTAHTERPPFARGNLRQTAHGPLGCSI